MARKQNPDTIILRAAEGFREGILNGRLSKGFCLAICLPLWAWLKSLGGQKRARLVELHFYYLDRYGNDETTNHFLIELEDGRVLDPTADQFERSPKFPKIYLGPMPDEYLAWSEAEALRSKSKVLAKKGTRSR